MKHLLSISTLALGLACAGGVSAAQDETQATTMRNINVDAVPAQYEIYVTDLQNGYKLQAMVGHTRRQYVQAQRAAERSEYQRKHGMTMQPLVAVAVDNYAGPGVARQFQLINSAHGTVAIVNVYCKRSVPSGGPRCKLAPLPIATNSVIQSLAATQAANLQVAEVYLRD